MITTSIRAVWLTLTVAVGEKESVPARIWLRGMTLPCNCASFSWISFVTPVSVCSTAALPWPVTVTSRTDPVVVVV